MLWDLIRDFFVQHIFGGYDSAGNPFMASAGYINSVDVSTGKIDESIVGDLGYFTYKVDNAIGGYVNYISMSDWLSTTATAIAITIIVVLCCLFIYKIVKLIGGLIR